MMIKIKKDLLKVNLKGELDHHMTQFIRDEIDYNIEKFRIKKLLFDFKEVSFMDSSGVGMILGRYKKLQRRKGEIGVVHLAPRIKSIFEISGLFSVIKHFNNEKDAFK